MPETERQGPDDERVSMWSVPRRFRRMYFPLFYLLGIMGVGWSVWYEASRMGSGASHHDVANAVIVKAPAVLLTAAFISLVITEATMVLAEMVGDYLKKRRDKIASAAAAKGFNEGFNEGKEAGIALGKEAGEATGAARMGRKWAEWNRRRLLAEERGEDFDEPPPDSDDTNGMNGSKPSD